MSVLLSGKASLRFLSLNPYKPSVRFVGHRQTVQNQIRRRKKRRLIGSPLFWYRIFYQNLNKIKKKNTQQPSKRKWTGPIDSSGKIHSA